MWRSESISKRYITCNITCNIKKRSKATSRGILAPYHANITHVYAHGFHIHFHEAFYKTVLLNFLNFLLSPYQFLTYYTGFVLLTRVSENRVFAFSTLIFISYCSLLLPCSCLWSLNIFENFAHISETFIILYPSPSIVSYIDIV